MNFPEIKETGNTKDHNSQTIKEYHIDWESFDNIKKEKHIDWIKKYCLSDIDPKQKDLYIRTVLPNLHYWQDFIGIPEKYRHILENTSTIFIPDDYLKEIKHFKEMALSEWNRTRPFDTNVRDTCLEVSQKAVEMFFYLISDSILIYNKEKINPYSEDENRIYNFEFEFLIPFFLYKFWICQTGRGLIVRNAFKRYVSPRFKIVDKEKEKLEKELTDFKGKYIPGITFMSVSDKKSTKDVEKLIKSYIREQRDKRIQNILD